MITSICPLCMFYTPCSLPYVMGHMPNLKSIVLDGNPLKALRRDIVQVSPYCVFSTGNKKVHALSVWAYNLLNIVSAKVHELD